MFLNTISISWLVFAHHYLAGRGPYLKPRCVVQQGFGEGRSARGRRAITANDIIIRCENQTKVLRVVRAARYRTRDKVRRGIASGREHEVLLNRGWALWVRGEVTTGGWEPKRALLSVGLARPYRRSGLRFFWAWRAGERKEPSSKNRKDRRKRRWRHEEERMRHVPPVHLC